MKITHISDYFSLKLGYQEVFLAKEEIKNGDEVYVLTSDKNYPFPNYDETYKGILGSRKIEIGEFKEEGIVIHRLKSIFEISSSALIIYFGILKNLKKIHPDVIICHDLIKPNNIRAYFYKILYNKSVKIIIDTHEAEYNTVIDSFLKNTYILLWKMFCRPLITQYSKKIVATGPNEKKFAQNFFLGDNVNIEVIPLGADIELFRMDKNLRNEMRMKYNIKNDEIVFINAGKINENKKNKELLEAFVHLYKSHKNTRLFFIGNGDHTYIDNMKKIVADNNLLDSVVFIPFVKNEELPKYFNMADVGIWPGSRSNVFWEAASCGLPLILEDIEYTRELVYEGKNGYLLRTITKDSVYECMCKIIKINIKEMGVNSREIIEKKFSWNAINQEFLRNN